LAWPYSKGDIGPPTGSSPVQDSALNLRSRAGYIHRDYVYLVRQRTRTRSRVQIPAGSWPLESNLAVFLSRARQNPLQNCDWKWFFLARSKQQNFILPVTSSTLEEPMAANGSGTGRLRVAPTVAAIMVAAIVISGAVAIVVPSLKTTTTVTETSNETTIVSMNGTTSSVYVDGGPFMFLTASGSCTADGAYVPCLGGAAYVFTCNGIQNLLAGPPPGSQECIQKVTSTMSPYPSADVTITILAFTQVRGLPSWTNCEWSVAGTPETGNDAYCIPVDSSTSSGSVSFIVGEPAGPPP